MDTQTLTPDPANPARVLWLQAARAQGLVCQICHEVPSYEEREQFFDTGVCVRCATDPAMASPLTA